MRVNLKCDKKYNGTENEYIVSSNCMDNKAIREIVERFAYLKNNKVNIDINKELVDFYNGNTDDIKSAQALQRYLGRTWVRCFGNQLFDITK